MKKLVFNEITKELDLVDQEESEEQDNEKNPKITKAIIEAIDKTRSFLERNKIFFETILMGAMTFATIIVYLVGNNISNISKEINKRELEIIENDRDPIFTLEKYFLSSKEGDGYKVEYGVENKGGIASDVVLFPILKADIYTDEKTFGVCVTDNVSVFSDDYYNFSEKTLFFDYEKSEDFFKKLESEIEESVFTKKYVSIKYTNYKNERIESYYYCGSDEMYLVREEDIWEYDDEKIDVFSDMTVEDVAKIIKGIISMDDW